MSKRKTIIKKKLHNVKPYIEGKKLEEVLKEFKISQPNSHKGQNGRLLVIGGSRLFHAASIWAARCASYFVDIVHYCSTPENNEIMLSLKKRFVSGIVVEKKDMLSYVEEDDCVLVGPGMVRGEIPFSRKKELLNLSFSEILSLKKEYEYTYALTYFLFKNFPEKRFVIDAGALQMMEKDWLLLLKTPAIITPHKKEFESLFGINPESLTKKELVDLAKKYNCAILLKKIEDVITDGKSLAIVKGGNAGLTKGGTGDVLAGLTAAFYTKNNPFISALFSSYLLKKASFELFKEKGYWYNIDDIIETCPKVLKKIFNGL